MRGGPLAVVIGSALGVAAAVAVRQSAEPSVRPLSPAAPAVPAAASSAVSPPIMPPASAEEAPSAPAATSAAPAEPPLSASVAPAVAPPPASTAPGPNIPEVPPLPPVTTAKEAEQAEVRCYQQRPDECDRAADAYDAGTLLPRDQERATKLRKVAFTYRVRACENRSPHACLVLAGRYQTGSGVEHDSHKAKLLFEHARELCSRKPNAECVGGEPH